VFVVFGIVCSSSVVAGERPRGKRTPIRNLRSPTDAQPLPIDVPSLRMRVQTREGVLVVYDAAAPTVGDPGCSGYIGYWWSARDKKEYIFPEVLQTEGDLAAMLLVLERDLGVDLEALADRDDRISEALMSAVDAPIEAIVWEPATLHRAVEIMGFEPGTDPLLIETTSPSPPRGEGWGEGGGTARLCEPCQFAGIGPPSNCGSAEGLAREGLTAAIVCCLDSGGGGPPPEGGGDGDDPPPCPSGQTRCGGSCYTGTSCCDGGPPCTGGTSCSNGLCCPSGQVGCDGGCYPGSSCCGGGPPCAGGTSCSNGLCCPPGQTRCNGGCTSSTCCAGGGACPAGQSCSNEVCCPSGGTGCDQCETFNGAQCVPKPLCTSCCTLQNSTCTPPGYACDGSGACKPGKDLIPQIVGQLGITYANQSTPGCPSGTCGAGIRFDVTGVTHSCDSIDMQGPSVTESVTTDNGCGPGIVDTGAGCPVNCGNSITGCTDTYAICAPPGAFPPGGCTDTYTQKLYVDGRLVETHTIVFTITFPGGTYMKREVKTLLPRSAFFCLTSRGAPLVLFRNPSDT